MNDCLYKLIGLLLIQAALCSLCWADFPPDPTIKSGPVRLVPVEPASAPYTFKSDSDYWKVKPGDKGVKLTYKLTVPANWEERFVYGVAVALEKGQKGWRVINAMRPDQKPDELHPIVYGEYENSRSNGWNEVYLHFVKPGESITLEVLLHPGEGPPPKVRSLTWEAVK